MPCKKALSGLGCCQAFFSAMSAIASAENGRTSKRIPVAHLKMENGPDCSAKNGRRSKRIPVAHLEMERGPDCIPPTPDACAGDFTARRGAVGVIHGYSSGQLPTHDV